MFTGIKRIQKQIQSSQLNKNSADNQNSDPEIQIQHDLQHIMNLKEWKWPLKSWCIKDTLGELVTQGLWVRKKGLLKRRKKGWQVWFLKVAIKGFEYLLMRVSERTKIRGKEIIKDASSVS